MTVSTADLREEYIATAGQTVFTFDFRVFGATDVKVYQTPAGVDFDDDTYLISAYTMTPNADQDANQGGTVTLNSGATLNDRITIISDVSETRSTDYKDGGVFDPDLVDDDMDRSLSIAKQAKESIRLAPRFNESAHNASGIELPDLTPNTIWRVNGSGTAIEAVTLGDGVISNGIPLSNYAALRAYNSFSLADGQIIVLSDNGGYFAVKSGAVSDDGFSRIVFTDNSSRYAERVEPAYSNTETLKEKVDDLAPVIITDFYVSTTGDDSNDGLTAGTPFETIQKAFDEFAKVNRSSGETCTIHLADGTYTEGAFLSNVISASEIIVEGASKLGTIIDGTTAVNTSGLNFNAMNRARAKTLTVQNFSSSGIAFQNGTRGVVDTCDASGNGFADFNASEDAELVVIGVCNLGSGSRYGMRVYRNSGASVGDGTNLVTIDGTTEAGLQVRDGSKCVCDNNIDINNCVSGVRLIKDGYVELRDSNITNNSVAGIFADSNSQYDNQTGTVNFAGNTVNKKFLGYSVDRSTLNLTGITPLYVPMYNFGTLSGVSPTSTYDMVLDGDRSSGIQVLGGGSLNLDANKTERLTLNSSDNTIRTILNGTEAYRHTTVRFNPSDDNIKDLGAASLRWNTVYAGTGTINTSDENEKTELLDVEEVEKQVAIEIKSVMKKFRFKDAVEAKGDSARIHFGVGAQTVKSIFENNGLDAGQYALFCYDEWEETKEVIPAVMEVDLETGKEIEVEPERINIRPAGSRYGIRYEELLCFIISAM